MATRNLGAVAARLQRVQERVDHVGAPAPVARGIFHFTHLAVQRVGAMTLTVDLVKLGDDLGHRRPQRSQRPQRLAHLPHLPHLQMGQMAVDALLLAEARLAATGATLGRKSPECVCGRPPAGAYRVIPSAGEPATQSACGAVNNDTEPSLTWPSNPVAV